MQSNTVNSFVIIIPYWHGAEYLAVCLQSIQESDLGTYGRPEVLIIHNGGEIPALDILKETWIKIIRTSSDIGFARAVNAGLSIALQSNVQTICILNQDTKLEKNCLRMLMDRAREPGLYIPVVMNYTLNAVDKDHAMKYTPGIKDDQSITEINLISGVCLCASADTYRSAGYFDTLFHMYYEDDDYGLRYRQKGGKLYVVPGAIVGHAGRSTEKYGGSDLLSRRKSAMILRIRHDSIFWVLLKILRDHLSALVHFRFADFWKIWKSDLSLIVNPDVRKSEHDVIQSRAARNVKRDLPAPWQK